MILVILRRVTNEAVIKLTRLVDLDKLKCGRGYDGLAMFTEVLSKNSAVWLI